MSSVEILDTKNGAVLRSMASNSFSLRDNVKQSLEHYFSQLEDVPPSRVYDMVMEEVEIPLLESMLKHTKGNQSKAAILLGISRGTLRKKLKIYDLED